MGQESDFRQEGRWQRRFADLAQLCCNIEWKPDSGSFYDELAGLVLESCGCDAVTLREFTITECRIVGAAFADAGEASGIRAEFASTPVGIGRMADMMEHPQPILLDFSHPGTGDDSGQFRSAAALGFQSALILKLIRGSDLFGDMVVSSRRADAFDGDAVEYVGVLAQVVGSFMEFHRISERQAEAAVLAECHRLMAEVRANQMNHLNAVRLESEQALNALWENDRIGLEEQLRLIAKTSGAAIDSLRDDMVMAAGTGTDDVTLAEQMEQLLERFEYMWSVRTALRASAAARAAVLSPLAAQQVIRMAHEALSNVNRHAQADSVSVDMDAQDGQLVVRIRDDGAGFDPARTAGAAIGLKAMRERMSLVGGELTVESQPGAGTTVVALVPVENPRR